MANIDNSTSLSKRTLIGLVAFGASAAISNDAVAATSEWYAAKEEYIITLNEINSGADDDGEKWDKAWHKLEKINPPTPFELSEKIRLLEIEIDGSNASKFILDYLMRDLKAMGVN